MDDLDNLSIDQLIACIKAYRDDLSVKDISLGTDRKIVERTVDCNTMRLYGPIDEAVKYLREIQARYPKAQLDERWTGYEDMELRFVWEEPQTDEEYRDDMHYLCEHAEYDRSQRDRIREEKRNKLLAEKNRIDKELKELG